jgi:hypothetical protein
MEEGLTGDVAAEGMMAWRIGCAREILVPRFAECWSANFREFG